MAGEERVATPPLLAQPWGHGMGPMVGRPGSSGSEPRMAEEDEETQNNVKRWFKRLQVGVRAAGGAAGRGGKIAITVTRFRPCTDGAFLVLQPYRKPAR